MAGLVVLGLILALVFGIGACRDSLRDRAIEDYTRDVNALVGQSQNQSDGLFQLLGQPGDQGPVDLQNAVNTYREDSEQLVDRARDLDPPDELDGAHGRLLDTLELRRDGMGTVARSLPAALGGRDREAPARVARGMESFLASDVLYTQRFLPAGQRVVREEELGREVRFPERGRFLPDVRWLRPPFISDRLEAVRNGGEPDQPDPAAGPRGTALGTVTVDPGGQALSEGTPGQIPAGGNVVFNVQVANQGAADLRDVTVRLAISGGEPREERIEDLPQGDTGVARIPLDEPPQVGQPVTVEVTVVPVAGEEMTENNSGSFRAVFTEG